MGGLEVDVDFHLKERQNLKRGLAGHTCLSQGDKITLGMAKVQRSRGLFAGKSRGF